MILSKLVFGFRTVMNKTGGPIPLVLIVEKWILISFFLGTKRNLSLLATLFSKPEAVGLHHNRKVLSI